MNFSKSKAIYTQISEHLCDEILKKMWIEEEKIPSIREMAVSLEVNPNTVVRSYAMLEQDGIIEMRRGIGYFVASQARSKVLNIKKEAFLNDELPNLFKAMDLLKIDIQELITLYQGRKQHENK
jgi:GntR family transcriptional regulator